MIRPDRSGDPWGLPPEMNSETLRLPDRRRLGLLQAGDPSGFPLLFFHGFGASRLGLHPDAGIARGLGIRLISLDRPGIGLSDPKPGRTVVSWADDVTAAVDALGIDRFAVLGVSAGGPHALACAVCLPQRVSAVGLVSSAAPLDDPALRPLHSSTWTRLARVGRPVPWLVRMMFDRVARQAHGDPEMVMEQAVEGMEAADRELVRQRPFYTTIMNSAVEAYVQGGQGVADDALALARPWGFALTGASTPVLLWHGEQDHNWPVALGRYLAQAVPTRHARFYPGEGHLIYLSHWAEILQAMREQGE